MGRSIPNHHRKNKIISFNSNRLSPSVLSHLNKLGKINKRGDFISDAINQHYFYITNFKFYIKQIIELNFGLVRHILRKVGRKNVDKL